MKQTIELFLDGEGWMTREKDNKELINLFGTDTLPTPFLKDTPWQYVVSVLEQLNPEKPVLLVNN